MNERRFHHLPFLDGIRAVSIALVVAWHARGQFTTHYANIFEIWLGVDAFFVLSGFLITSLLVQERRDSGSFSLGSFYARRVLRIFPAYFVFLGAMMLRHGRPAVRPLEMAAIYLNNYDHAHKWGFYASYPGGFTPIAHVWSLCIEEQFYLLWPLVLSFIGRHDDGERATIPRGLKLTLAAVAAVMAWKAVLLFHDPSIDNNLLYYPFETRADSILIGCAAALAWAHPPTRRRIRAGLGGRWIPAVLLVALAAAMQNVRTVEQRWVFNRVLAWVISFPVYAGLIAALILALIVQPSSAVATALSHPVMRWIGRLSYSIYLWHLFALTEAKTFVQSALPSARPLVVDVLVLLVGAALSLLLASASHYLIERPFLRLKQRFQAPSPVAAIEA